jgi:hypothetical protein
MAEYVLYRVERGLVAVLPGSENEKRLTADPAAFVRRVGPLLVSGAPRMLPTTYAIFLTPVDRSMFAYPNGSFNEAQASRTYTRSGYCLVYSC